LITLDLNRIYFIFAGIEFV